MDRDINNICQQDSFQRLTRKGAPRLMMTPRFVLSAWIVVVRNAENETSRDRSSSWKAISAICAVPPPVPFRARLFSLVPATQQPLHKGSGSNRDRPSIGAALMNRQPGRHFNHVSGATLTSKGNSI